MAREDELEAGRAEPFDQIDDLAAGMTHDVVHAHVAQSLADQPPDGADLRRLDAQSESCGATATTAVTHNASRSHAASDVRASARSMRRS